jgi:DNA-binding CsgD family transcriptional regulator
MTDDDMLTESTHDVITVDNELIVSPDISPVNTVINASDSYVSSRVGNSSVIARTDRMRKVADRYAFGMSAADIAKDLDIDIRTATNDIASLQVLLKAPTDIEALRRQLSLRAIEIQDIARDRYVNDGIPVEGRLALDASTHVAKLHGLYETDATQAIGAGLAGLLASLGAADDDA